MLFIARMRMPFCIYAEGHFICYFKISLQAKHGQLGREILKNKERKGVSNVQK